MPSPKEFLADALVNIEASELSFDPIESKFVGAIAKTMPEGQDLQEKAVFVSSALERLLQRHHDDSRLIVSTSAALGEASEYEVPEFIRKLSRLTKFLEAPVAAHSVKTFKLANFVVQHPETIEIRNFDSIQALARLPEGSVKNGLKKGEIQIGEETIRIARADPKEITAAVRKVKEASAAVKKKEKAESISQAIEDRKIQGARAELEEEIEESSDRSEDIRTIDGDDAINEESLLAGLSDEEQETLQPQFSEAATALTKVLGTLSQGASNSHLSQVLLEARKLLMLVLRPDDLTLTPVEEMEGQTGDFH